VDAGNVILIYENEFSSFISYALSSVQYKEEFEDLLSNNKNDEANVDFLLTTLLKHNNNKQDEQLKRLLLSPDKSHCITRYVYQTGVYKMRYYCTSYYAKQFYALRKLYFDRQDESEEQFIESLARCQTWNAKGGKSGSYWAKTLDNRFLLKNVSNIELTSFLEFAPLYFKYLAKAFFAEMPTQLAKIVGIFSINYKNSNGRKLKYDLVVMENLFYNRTITKTFDLKGSVKNRYSKRDDVLLDENLLRERHKSPLCITPECKRKMNVAISNDTLFLSSMNVMDYSLLVGVDETANKLVVGIIDFFRTYTWDKQLESWVKSLPVGNRGAIPTVISPAQYKKRYCEAMNAYFIMICSIHYRIC